MGDLVLGCIVHYNKFPILDASIPNALFITTYEMSTDLTEHMRLVKFPL